MELGSIMEFLDNNPLWSLLQLEFLQRVIFCGADIEGSTQSEEALSSSKSRGRTLDLLKKACIMR
ncbi:hypothetical protein POTOM_060993 [Populus tomentosa]|uniref:Uncharacterized protein n=1 Tax=Populus tomentosa TaxID=118781 RepID=A0A8X8C0K8_POPTO|nr:hypothetical protein POTOM_060993 [Populus tomentosa]